MSVRRLSVLVSRSVWRGRGVRPARGADDAELAELIDVATDLIWRMAKKAMLRCSRRDWTEALAAARSVVEEARTGLPPGATGKEQLAVLVALRMIEVWMRQER